MTAGIVTLSILQEPGIFDQLVARTKRLCAGIGQAAQSAGVPVTQTQVGTMFCTYFAEGPVTNWSTASNSDTEKFGRFFHAMLKEGVYIAPSQFEAGFMSTAHTDEVIETTVAAAQTAFQAI